MKYPQVRLSELVEIKGGKRLPKEASFVSHPTAHPYIRAQDIRGGKIRFDDPVCVTDEVFQKIKRYTVKPNDVCITIVGANVGDVGIVLTALNGANLTENAVKLTAPNENCDLVYLMYCLLTHGPQAEMKLFAGGAAQPKLGIYKINEIKIPLPPLIVQRRTAAILSTYDELIENNARRIKILEEMAQALYREWFVELRFPGHERVKVKNSVPEGWEARKVGDVLELAYGKGLKADRRMPGPFPVYGSAGVVGYHNESLVKGPGIIVGRKGNVGSVFWSNNDFYPIDTVFYVRTKISLHYIYYNLQSQHFINNDAAVPGLNRNQAHSLPFLLPPIELLEEFQAFVDPIFLQRNVLTAKNAILCQTRDLLLARLVSGELDVADLEIALE
jgi:type I restriction enzyme, S subunit